MQATIRNDFLTLTVDTHGAEAVSVQNAQGQEMLWQGDKSVWGRHAPILFPWTGKLAGGILTHAGKSYKGGQHGLPGTWSTRCCPTDPTPSVWSCARTSRPKPIASPMTLCWRAPSGWTARRSATP